MSTKDKLAYHGTYALALALPYVLLTFGAFGVRVKG